MLLFLKMSYHQKEAAAKSNLNQVISRTSSLKLRLRKKSSLQNMAAIKQKMGRMWIVEMCICAHGMQSRHRCAYHCRGRLVVPVCVCIREAVQTTARITYSLIILLRLSSPASVPTKRTVLNPSASRSNTIGRLQHKQEDGNCEMTHRPKKAAEAE